MEEILIFGRGGQGAVTAAQILATAAFNEGRWAQTFPQFGAERRGAPVLAYVRLDDRPIPLRTKVYEADTSVVMDFNLFKMINPLGDLKAGGLAILNHPGEVSDLPDEVRRQGASIKTLDATRIAHQIYGRTTIPITNVIILGAYCAASGSVSLASVIETLPDFFSQDKVAQNVEAVRLGYESLGGE